MKNIKFEKLTAITGGAKEEQNGSSFTQSTGLRLIWKLVVAPIILTLLFNADRIYNTFCRRGQE